MRKLPPPLDSLDMARKPRHPSTAFHTLERGGLEHFFSVNYRLTSICSSQPCHIFSPLTSKEAAYFSVFSRSLATVTSEV